LSFRLWSTRSLLTDDNEGNGKVRKYIKLTEKLIRAGGTSGIAWNRRQMTLLGIGWPLKKGWMKELIGLQVPDEIYLTFLSLKKSRPSPPSRPKRHESTELVGRYYKPSEDRSCPFLPDS